jgi:hypothetical protein
MTSTHLPLSAAVLRASWRHSLLRQTPAAGPAWLMWIWPLVYAGIVAIPFTVLGFVLYADGNGAWRNVSGWADWYGRNYVVSLCITLAVMACFTVLRRGVGLARMQRWSAGKRSAAYSVAAVLAVSMGWPLGYWLVGGQFIAFTRMNGNAIASTLLMMLLITWLFQGYFSLKRKELTAQLQAQEARLRLLQGQIEPHFLFNTLANVISMIDHDPQQARHTLEAFTHWLRASLCHLRREASPLSAELDLISHFLTVMQARLGDRLQVEWAIEPTAPDALLPALVLQPLVENAIAHAIEPSVAGGWLRVSARRLPAQGRVGERLELCVDDEGLDWDGAAPPPSTGNRRGNGVALENLRERLHTLYGEAARLTLSPRHPGTRARIELPWQIADTSTPARKD